MTAYLYNHRGYPIVTAEGDVIEALRDPFTQAVTLRDPTLSVDPSCISAPDATELAALYWSDPAHKRGRLASGETVYRADVTPAEVQKESSEAGIVIATPQDVEHFADHSNRCRAIFTRACNQLITEDIKAQRGFLLFTPKGGRGRSPETHIDYTYLSLHSSVALSTFKMMFGEADEKLWMALHLIRQENLPAEQRAEVLAFLIEAAKNPDYDFRDNELGDVVIARGRRGRDLSQPAQRQGLCIHVSSDTIITNGQAAYLMTPEMA